MPRAVRKSQPLRKSSVSGNDTESAAVGDRSLTEPVTASHDGAVRDESPTTPVTSVSDTATSIGDESGTAAQPERPDDGDSGQGGVTRAVSKERTETRPLRTESSPTPQAVVTKSILAALLEELATASPEQIDELRRALLPPPAAPQERRRGHRKTFAWYIDEALGAAVQAKAQAEGAPPSEVAERILRQAKTLGWI